MTIKETTKAFKTKLRINNKKQFDYLMKTAKACKWIRNWYVKESLKRMKEDGITVFSSKEDLEKYSPWEMNKVLTKLINTSADFAWLKGVPSYPRSQVLEHLRKTYGGSTGVKYNFMYQCSCIAERINKRIEQLKVKAKKEGRKLTEEEIEKAKEFYGKGKKSHKIDDLYYVKGFPRFEEPNRHLSFVCTDTIFDVQNKSIALPGSRGDKKFEIMKLEPTNVHFFDHGFNSKDINKEARVTFSYDGENWWVSVKQIVEEAISPTNEVRDKVIGIDVGITNTIYASNGQKIESIATNEKVKKLEEKRKYLDGLRKKNLEKSPKEKIETPWGKKVKLKSAKYKKLTKHIQHIDNKILYIRDSLVKQLVSEISLKEIKGIVLEDFDVESIKKNKKWAGKVQRSNIGAIRQKIIERAENLGISVKCAPKFYPSTQICSKCGKQNLHMRKNLKARTFVCEYCGHTLNRDLNASINLANLWGSSELVNWENRKKRKLTK